jgi:hypothetical protein
MSKITLVVEETMTIKEAAFFLKVCQTTIRRLREEIDPLTGKPYLEACQPCRGHILISVVKHKDHRQRP